MQITNTHAERSFLLRCFFMNESLVGILLSNIELENFYYVIVDTKTIESHISLARLLWIVEVLHLVTKIINLYLVSVYKVFKYIG